MRAIVSGIWPGGSGAQVAALFQRVLAAIFLLAWLSLGWQVRVLIGENGLLPLWSFLDAVAHDGGLPLFAYPSLLRWQSVASDGALVGGTVLGAAFSIAALVGLRPRLFLALCTFLYLSYAAACRTFHLLEEDAARHHAAGFVR